MEKYVSPAVLRAFLVVVIAGVVGYLALTGQPIDEMFANALLMILGYLFGRTSNSNSPKPPDFGE